MTKQQLLTTVQAKIGFHSIIQDELARDHVPGDPIEKRFLYVNHANADGTMGKTYVYYLHDVQNDVASFYNVEPESVDVKEPSADQKKVAALENYLKANFNAFFVNRVDLKNNFAHATVYKLDAGNLVESKVIVYKMGTNPISHLPII